MASVFDKLFRDDIIKYIPDKDLSTAHKTNVYLSTVTGYSELHCKRLLSEDFDRPRDLKICMIFIVGLKMTVPDALSFLENQGFVFYHFKYKTGQKWRELLFDNSRRDAVADAYLRNDENPSPKDYVCSL